LSDLSDKSDGCAASPAPAASGAPAASTSHAPAMPAAARVLRASKRPSLAPAVCAPATFAPAACTGAALDW